MPVTTVRAAVTALSMAGLPLLDGVLSKKPMLEEAARTARAGAGWPVQLPVTPGALLSVACAVRVLFQVFGGPRHDGHPRRPQDPPFGMWAVPGLLALMVVAIGLFPNVTAGPILHAAADAVVGGGLDPHEIRLWHGLTPALFTSAVAIPGGAVVLAFHRRPDGIWQRLRVPAVKDGFDAGLRVARRGGRAVTDGLHDGRLGFDVAAVALGARAFTAGEHAGGQRPRLPASSVDAIGRGLLVAATAAMAVLHRNCLLVLALMGIFGLGVSLAFVHLSAPDLAMTQVWVEEVAIVLLLLALNVLPRECPKEDSRARQLRDGASRASPARRAAGFPGR